MADHKITEFGSGPNRWTLNQTEAARQAIASLRGYVFQLHASLLAWMHLPSDGELYLEVAEDYAELLAAPGNVEEILSAVQVKDTRESGSVTLNSVDVLKTIEALFSLQESNPGRQVFMKFLTTSPVGKELKAPLPSGAPALEAWAVAASGGDATELLDALKTRITDGKLGEFLKDCSLDEFHNRLLSRLTFACGAPSWEQLEEDGRNHLVRIRQEVSAEVNAARQAYDTLFGVLYREALKPHGRKLDRQKFLDAFAEATAYSLPSQVVADLAGKGFRSGRPSARSGAVTTVNASSLREAARKLSDQGRAQSLLPLFPDASGSVRMALENLSNVERWVVWRASAGDRDSARLRLADLVHEQELHHLVYAEPGAGKSHALFRLTAHLLGETIEENGGESSTASDGDDNEQSSSSLESESNATIPLLLPIGGITTASEVLAQIEAVLPGSDPVDALKHRDVCVLLDGWSEFATGENFTQRAVLLRSLSGVRVVACARHADASDSTFKCWSLERLSPVQARTAVAQAFDEAKVLGDELVDLLRLPLMLSLYLLLGGATSTPGELVAHFHRHLAKHLPEQFDEALADAVSQLSLTAERSYNKFLAALRKASATRNVTAPLSVLHNLGTMTQRGSVVVAVHDLYWSWLAGVGLLRGARTNQAVFQLDTRESLALALQSGELVDAAAVASTVDVDAVLAAAFDSSLGMRSIHPSLATKLDAMFCHTHLAVRCRAAIAGFQSGRATYVRKALEVLDDISTSKLHVPELLRALDMECLLANRATLGSWLGGAGTPAVVDAIATNGDNRWLSWIEQMFHSGRLEPKLALATALALENQIPEWGAQHLEQLISESPWLLGFASNRRANKELALWLVRNYPQAPVEGGGGWWYINRALVSCGNEQIFLELLHRFPTMSTSAQRLLGMAIPELGDALVAEFQKQAFAEGDEEHHYRLAETLSLKIDDSTAREWIERGHFLSGWRVLLGRHGKDVLPELLALLPSSFGGHQRLLALEAICFLKDPPASLLEELESRTINSTSAQLGISPKVGETIIRVALAVKPQGLGWLIRQCLGNPNAFRGYHAKMLFTGYMEAQKATGLRVTLGTETHQVPFEHWYATLRFIGDWDEHMSPEALKLVPQMAVSAVLHPFANDDEKAKKVLERLESLSTYDDALFERMISSPALTPLITKVFADAWNSFPSSQLLRLVQSSHVEYDEPFFYSLRTATEPSFYETHLTLARRIIAAPLNLHNIRCVANMLRSYPKDALPTILQPLLPTERLPTSDCLHWLLREAGTVRRELLADEQGNPLGQ